MQSPFSLYACFGLLTLALGCATPATNASPTDAPSSVSDAAAGDGQRTTADAALSDVAAADVAAADVAEDAAGADTCVALATSGEPPEKTVAAPTFSDVLTHEGVGADPAALKGKWTVMWFYPAASTAG